ncbi:LOW QUALITY PROTEIN: ARL14 effector protein-like [Drosophila ficusphila]|uniref:LOW QUALITY PROTEIN: ARL14 effector protein-like n=1 Tax=Drosophila ficusphila TaxID=30025 RepID=UPI001C896ABE|nr:LOW QUALITY PROTEIN: ARL14 effector protein-like [Drosophila ficusphila]XP_043063717.1 LOW QUALITY PROTEIN: ARL14 effector protein-like [Drosophila ficusphila]
MCANMNPEYSIGRNLRQRNKKNCVSNDDAKHDLEINKKKAKRKGNCGRSSVYDEYGKIRTSGLDICDCMNDKCDGCWYECQNCGSTKCGPECRSNRKFFYEGITYDGKDLSIHNKYISK